MAHEPRSAMAPAVVGPPPGPAPGSAPNARGPGGSGPAERKGGVSLRAEGLRKTFVHGGRNLDVLRGIDLSLAAGEIASVVGASGAGKSTLLHVLGTLDLPTSGRILFDGQDITRLTPPALADFRNREIGFVFQFHHLLPEFTALENAMMPALIGRLAPRVATERAEALLRRVGLGDRLTHRPGELSGGEQQRVALARALVMGPRFLLADEPTGNLDTRTSREMHDLFFQLNREMNMTILLVTHNDELASQAGRRLRMVDGTIREEA